MTVNLENLEVAPQNVQLFIYLFTYLAVPECFMYNKILQQAASM